MLSQPDSQAAGVFLGILSAACVGLTSALTNTLAGVVSSAEVAFALGVAGVLTLTPLVYQQLPGLFAANATVVWVRAVAGAVSIVCFIWNLQHADVGIAHILFNFSLIFVLAAEYATGRPHCSTRVIACVVMAAVGIAVYWYGGKLLFSAGVLAIGLFGAVSATLAYVALSRASVKYDPLLILWALSLMLIPVSAMAKSGSWVVPSGKVLLILIIISLGNLLAQFLLNLSFKRLPLPLATAIVPSCVVWSVFIVGITQGVAPAPHAMIGMLIYAVSMGVLITHSRAKAR